HPTFSFFSLPLYPLDLPSFPTRRSSDLLFPPAAPGWPSIWFPLCLCGIPWEKAGVAACWAATIAWRAFSWSGVRGRFAFVIACRSEEHTFELQSLTNLVCRLLLEKKNYV